MGTIREIAHIQMHNFRVKSGICKISVGPNFTSISLSIYIWGDGGVKMIFRRMCATIISVLK